MITLIISSLIALMLFSSTMLALYHKWKNKADKWANYALDAQEQLAGDLEGKAEFESMRNEYDKDFNPTPKF